jgi:mRNA-degrading endonuclease YafQ of YafQ-DinJ toxin-antitoxin module
MAQLTEVMLLIADDGPLLAEWSDHALQGPWTDDANAMSAATFC